MHVRAADLVLVSHCAPPQRLHMLSRKVNGTISSSAVQAEVLWLMAAKTKWQESDAQKHESEAARRAGDEKAAAELLQQSRELLEAARGILYSANIANSGTQTYKLTCSYLMAQHSPALLALQTAGA